MKASIVKNVMKQLTTALAINVLSAEMMNQSASVVQIAALMNALVIIVQVVDALNASVVQNADTLTVNVAQIVNAPSVNVVPIVDAQIVYVVRNVAAPIVGVVQSAVNQLVYARMRKKMKKKTKTKNKPKPVELVIDRSRWANGKITQLYDADTKKMDCLGFIARQLCGARVKDISGFFTPADCLGVQWIVPLRPINISDESMNLFANTFFVSDLIAYNDSNVMTTKAREKNIASHLGSIGIKAKFVGRK